MGGLDFGFNFDGFEENVKKFMELPIKYIDSAHDKAVEFIEDIQAVLYPPFSDDGESVETELVGPSTETSPPASIITAETSSTDCIDTDVQENTSPKGDQIKENDLCLLPEETSKTETSDSCTSEEVILWNPTISVEPPQAPETTTISQDDDVPPTMDTDKVTGQVGLCCSGHSDIQAESSVCNGTILLENSTTNFEEQMALHCASGPMEAKTQQTIPHDLGEDVSRGVDARDVWPDGMVQFADMDLRDDQEHMESDKLEAEWEHMKNEKFEASLVHHHKSKSFKKTFMRTLSSKLRWSKKGANTHQAVPSTLQDPENHGYRVVSSPDDLEDGWELV